MEYTHVEYCYMLFTLGACNIHAGTDVKELTLHYSGWCHPDANVFWQLHQCHPETWSLTPAELVNARHAQTVQTPAISDDIIAAVEWKPSRSSCDTAPELGLPQPKVFEAVLDDHLDSYQFLQNAHLHLDDFSPF